MTSTVLLRCAGPMQSWGTRSRFGNRDTEREPSKSGVIGIVAAALGRSRDAVLDDLASLRMCTRIDNPGRVMTDYQTALGVAKADGGSPGTVISHRHYLADASFLVALEGETSLCETVHQALLRPRWPLFLGRKSYVPGVSVAVRQGVQDMDGLLALRSIEWPRRKKGGGLVERLDAIVECKLGEQGDSRLDVPICFRHEAREYSARMVRRITITPAEQLLAIEQEAM